MGLSRHLVINAIPICVHSSRLIYIRLVMDAVRISICFALCIRIGIIRHTV